MQGAASDLRSFLIPFSLSFLLFAGGMALHAVLEIGDAFFPVLILRLRPVMFVALIACVRRERLRVAGPAGARAALSVVGGEGMGAIVTC